MEIIAHKLEGTFLSQVNRLKMMKPETRNLLQVAFDHGGYVAGGFGTIIARYHLGIIPDEERLWDAVRSHLGSPSSTREGMFANAGCGDIDIWFPDSHSHMAFCRDERRLRGVALKETLTGSAEEHLIDGDARVQVIRNYLAPMRDQIAKFDIYNGSVAFNNEWLLVPEHFEMLERAHTIHVSTWESPWTMNRFFKWIQRKRWYKHATPATAQYVYDQVLKMIEWKRKHANNPEVMNDPRVKDAISKSRLKKRILSQDSFRMQELLGPTVTGLTGEQLLEISAFFPEPLKYDLAMREIHRRMPPT